MAKLAPGMTIQSDPSAVRSKHYVYCVRCRWASEFMTYELAKKTAKSEDSHECNKQ